MKVILKACLAVAFLFAACQNDPTQSEQYKQLEQDKNTVAERSSE